MTNEEALERIDYARRNCDNDMDCDGQCDLCDEAMEMATQALEKQIPKPLIDGDKCPVCGRYDTTSDTGYQFPYCPDCGQKLEYSND